MLFASSFPPYRQNPQATLKYRQMINTDYSDIWSTAHDFLAHTNPFRSIILLLVSFLAAYWVSRFIALGIIKFAQVVSKHTDNETDSERLIRLRQVETYLSVTVAIVRTFVVMVVAYVGWLILSPTARISGNLAAIGAGAVFALIAGQTIGILLRDVTAGATMIIEKWFNVGDYIKIEPFGDVAGIVERFTLRATKIRTIRGEIIWVHNQQISAVQVTPGALHTMAVDLFVHNRIDGERAIEKVIDSVPTGPTLLARPLRIKYAEKWNDELWRITVVGQMPPGREWLVEQFFVDAIKAADAQRKKADKVFVYEPIARAADSEADRRFKRAVRVKKNG